MRQWIVRTMVIAAAAGLVAPPAVAAADEPSARLRSELNELVAAAGVPGAQLVYTSAGGVEQYDSGTGDLTTGAPFPDDAGVRVASITKTFVATVVLQLVAEGLVDLDSPVERYLPGVVHGPGGDGALITVRDLLRHTSGIPNYLPLLDQRSVEDLTTPRTRGDLIRLALAQQAESEPGTTFGYSNTNYLLAGDLIERVTGLPVGIAVTQRILLPLELFDTYWPLFPFDMALHGPHPRAYHRFDDTRVDITDIDAAWGLPDGAMVSTGRDLNRFYLALLSGRLLAPDQLEEMRRTVPTGLVGYSEASGLGLFRFSTECGRSGWGHTGSIQGASTVTVADGERAVTVAMNELPDFAGNIALIIGIDAVLEAVLCEV
ncbi:serine hydrolase domain-containing protein [Nocardia bovistercoris]|uniref:Beta-lactamase family protein n=1 Tax=Nocardia bovistercoris TaxID=2785916 RepID=A0A931N4M9_9NOCA|nr:serine hydrolase domain-containing protein [Nocardia bovistercoris]MBH0778431.1 beta-lactamase family protein [Nocardia bovistercoris]